MPPVYENVRNMERKPFPEVPKGFSAFPEVPKGLDPELDAFLRALKQRMVELDTFLRALRQRMIDGEYKMAKDFEDIHVDLVGLIP